MSLPLRNKLLFLSFFFFLLSRCSIKDNPAIVPGTPKENLPPDVKLLTVDEGCCQPGGKAVLSASVSDPDKDNLSILWTATGGTLDSSTRNFPRTLWTAPATTGTFTVTISVSDGVFTKTGSTEIKVISSSNQLPTISGFNVPSSLKAGQMATLTAQGSDPEGSSLSYTWGQSCLSSEEGSFSLPAQNTTTYQAPLKKTKCVISLSVRDGAGTGTDGRVQIVNVAAYEPIFSFGQKGKCGSVEGCRPEDLFSPTALALDSANQVYIADSRDGRIKKFSPSGSFLASFPLSPSCTSSSFSLCAPRDIYIKGDAVFATEDDKNTIFRFNRNLEPLEVFGGNIFQNSLIDSPGAMAADSAGNLYVYQADQCTITKFSPSGTFQFRFSSNCQGLKDSNLDANGGLIPGVAVNSLNEVIVSDPRQHRLAVFDTSGNLKTFFGSKGEALGQFTFPAQLFVDASNNLYVADRGKHRIQIFTRLTSSNLASQLLTAFGSQGTKAGEFQNPVDMALASNGDIYVLDAGNHRVQVFRLQNP